MATRVQCPRCGSFKSWILKRGGRRCANCRFDWRPERWPLRLSAREWRRLLQWFVRGAPSAAIAREAHLDRKRVLRALAVVRRRIAQEPPPGVRHALEELEHHTAEHPPAETPPAAATWPPPKRPSRRTAVLGLYADQGLVWADVVPAADADVLREQLKRPPHHVIADNGAGRYAALVYRGRLHRVTSPTSTGEAATQPFGLVASFWSYLQRQLRTKGGIRLERLNQYLAEWAWRYNHRRLSAAEQLRELLLLTRHAGRRTGTLPHEHARRRVEEARDPTHRLPS